MLGPEFASFLASCSPRQQQVARLLIEGSKSGEIARALGISQGRVIQIRHDLAQRYVKLDAKLASEGRFRKLVQKHSIKSSSSDAAGES